LLIATPTLAKDYTIKEVTDYAAKKQNFFAPDKLTIQVGDTVIFENAADELHEVMFISVPKQVDEMIMSPMHEKKGDQFSYTFTVPGTYKFHCHPHEALGMDGTLIVGQPSKAGETKMMDHHKMAKKLDDGTAAVTTNLPQGTGKIISVNTEKHTLKLTHDPIKSLNWPKMTMLFTADSTIDLAGFAEGDVVSFTLKPSGADDYIITAIKKGM
jgi:Cu(I)/Ag(I) efflux system periplasmic protein CusF